jgi:hypothetical protein
MRPLFSFVALLATAATSVATEPIRVEILEGVPEKRTWDVPLPQAVESFPSPAFGFPALPAKYTPRGVLADRPLPIVVRASAAITLPAGEYRFLLRSRNASRLSIDGSVIASTEFLSTRGDGHEAVPIRGPVEPNLRETPVGHQDKIVTRKLDGKPHRFTLEAFVGGLKLRPEVGELAVAVAAEGTGFRLLSPNTPIELSDEGWERFAAERLAWTTARNRDTRRAARASDDDYWAKRHELARREIAARTPLPIPVVSAKIPVFNPIDRFIGKRLEEAGVAIPPLTDDLTFARRVFLDTVGVIPTPVEISRYLNDPSSVRRQNLIDRLLADPRWADHWVSYWQDVLAENPGILKPNLNNTGPFRWWLHEALTDNLPMDRFATELIRMEGSKYYGGPAGFGVATENDAPMAAKAHVLAKAFLGMEMQCARCHDAPFHPFTQRDLFELAAMLNRGPQTLPATSTVPTTPGSRKPRVTVALAPGTKVAPRWSFPDLAPGVNVSDLVPEKGSTREQFAAFLTSAKNDRFAEVLANRVWQRFLGRGLVDPVDDWLDANPSHPELLQWLGREFVTMGYDLKAIARLILTSQTYQRAIRGNEAKADATALRLFASPARRRMTAEQLVDSLFVAAGKALDCEPLTMDPEGRRPATEMLNLGIPTRAWQLTSLSNERDRPALALPQAQGIVDLMAAYGWRDSRPNPITTRDDAPTPLQPMELANGIIGNRIVRLSDDSALTALALLDQPLDALVDAMFQRLLTRAPTSTERQLFAKLLADGYADRRRIGASTNVRKPRLSSVSWANHLSPEATKIKMELERAARAGDPATNRLTPDWRERMEDAVWAMINSPEFVFVP